MHRIRQFAASLGQRARILIILITLVATILFTERRAESYGDHLQVALPVLALGCSFANGQAGEFLIRYGVMFFAAHASKRGLGQADINARPAGGYHGMPSAHTSTAVLGASSLVHDCITGNPVVKAIIIGTAGFVGASRIEAGKHNIWQVLLGAILGYLCDRLFRRGRNWDWGQNRGRGLIIGAFQRLLKRKKRDES